MTRKIKCKTIIIIIIIKIDSNDWDSAKSIWVNYILRYKSYLLIENEISLFGNEYEFFIQYVVDLQEYQLKTECSANCSENNIVRKQKELYFNKYQKQAILSFKNEKCLRCSNLRNNEITFIKTPSFLFIQTKLEYEIFKEDVPKQLEVNSLYYKFLCATINKDNHFRAIFYLNNSFHLIDDLKNDKILTRIPRLNIISCVYYLE